MVIARNRTTQIIRSERKIIIINKFHAFKNARAKHPRHILWKVHGLRLSDITTPLIFTLKIYLNRKRICNKTMTTSTLTMKATTTRHGISKLEHSRNHWDRCFLCCFLFCFVGQSVIISFNFFSLFITHINISYTVCNGRKIIIISARSRIAERLECDGWISLCSYWVCVDCAMMTMMMDLCAHNWQIPFDWWLSVRSSIVEYMHDSCVRWWRFTF